MKFAPSPTAMSEVSYRTLALIAACAIAMQASALLAMGQPPICTCGTIRLWTGDVLSAENSQQLTDWYSFTHILHGFAFYGLLWLIAPRLSVGQRFAIAICLEAGWEIVENTPVVIERYRQSAMARGYFGDSVINSMFDTVTAAIGVVLARALPVWATLAVAAAIELFLGLAVRDGLVLNFIQLLAPNDALSRWQMGQ